MTNGASESEVLPSFLRRIQGLSSGGSIELGLAKPCQPFNRVRWKLGPNFALGAKLIARLGFQSLSSVHQRWSLCRFEPLLFVGGTLRPMIMALHAPCAHLTSGLQVRLRQAFANRRYRPFSVIVRS